MAALDQLIAAHLERSAPEKSGNYVPMPLVKMWHTYQRKREAHLDRRSFAAAFTPAQSPNRCIACAGVMVPALYRPAA